MSEWNYEFFTRKEMACRCGNCGGVPPDSFMKALVGLRRECGFPFVISSGYRCPEYNHQIGGTYDGPHTRGAADILVYGSRAFRIIELAFKYGFTGFGINQIGPQKLRFIHLDRVPVFAKGFTRPIFWSYA